MNRKHSSRVAFATALAVGTRLGVRLASSALLLCFLCGAARAETFADLPRSVRDGFRRHWGAQAEQRWDEERARDIATPGWREGSPIADTARRIMTNGRGNPFENGADYWDNWCLGFVNIAFQDTYGRADPQLADWPINSARESFYAMQRAGRVETDFDAMPPGAAVYWANYGYGHVAIFSGRRTAEGDPILITTTGWNGWSGIQELPMDVLTAATLGSPGGWVKL